MNAELTACELELDAPERREDIVKILWRAVLGGLGEQWRLQANEPEDPEAN